MITPAMHLIGERLRRRVADALPHPRTTVSVGCAPLLPVAGRESASADLALYETKQSGGNLIAVRDAG